MWCYTLFPIILNMSLTAGIVIVFVLLARLPLRKAPKIFSYALWAVVLFRLLCPVSFSSDFSLLGVFHAPAVTNGSIAYIPADIVHAANPQVDLLLPGVSEVINESLPQNAEQIVADPLEAPMVIATLLWLGGIAAMLVYSTASLLSLKRKLVGAVRLRENIYLAEHFATPFVIGLIHPKTYLPSALPEKEQAYIILHEQTHIRRLDHIVRLVAFLALVVHWFNPLVWVAFILSGKDMEMSCDEAVMKKMGDGIRAEYSALLLRLAAGRKIVAGAPLAFGEGDTKSRIKNVLNYKKPAFQLVIIVLIAVSAVCVGLAANPRNNSRALDSFTANLLQYRTEYIGDNSKVGGIINTLEYPDKITYDSFALHTESPPLAVTVNLDTDAQTRNFYTGALHEGPFRKNAILMFSLIHNVEYITFVLDDGTNPYAMQFTRDMADHFAGGDVWSYSSSPEQLEMLLKMTESIEIVEPEPWIPQPEYENQDDYSEAVETAMKSVKPEEVLVDDMGSNEKTALAWMEAWFHMLKALPGDNMAHISEGAVDRLEIIRVSKEGLPKAFVFSVTFSVRPTYPIASNAFWMAGNTGNSPGRDETWGQMSRQVELRLGDDGKYRFVSMGTGGVGNGDDYEDPSQQAAESWEIIVKADVNRDGLKEAFYLDKSHMDSGPWVTLRLRDGSGNEIWSEDAGIPHVGWNSLFLCEQEGEYYLLRYNPGMWQGYCTYTYSLFTLEGGAEHVVRSNTLDFDVNGTAKLDAPEMVAFADEVNALLGKSTLLLSSEGGNYSFGPSAADRFLERYSWLDETPELYANGDGLETRLVKYSEYAVSNH